MFSIQQLNSIDTEYFRIIRINFCSVTIQSRNTGHCWHILEQDYPSFYSCRIYHTHHFGTEYHEHGRGKSLESCIQQIMAHDAWWLEHEERRHRRRILRIRHEQINDYMAIEYQEELA